MPGLRGAEMSDVEDVDGCDYDLVADDDFVLGRVPGRARALLGVGWRGTGYKFAPWVGRVLAELAVQDGTVYDIARFSPARFQPIQEEVRRKCVLQQRLDLTASCSAPRATSSSSSAAATSRPGPFVPEVVLDAARGVRQLHREFLRAGADVMVALTYYAHREKLKVVGRDGQLEEMNRAAVRIAREVAAEGDALVAGNICNTWSYDPARPVESGAVVRAQYEEQLGWAVEEGVDFVIAETNDFVGEALIALEVCQSLGLPGMVTFASVQPDTHLRRLRLRRRVPRCSPTRAPRSSASTARAGRRRCCRCSSGSAPRSTSPVAAQPVPYQHPPGGAGVRVAERRATARALFPIQLERFQCTRFEMADFARRARDLGVDYIGVCCGAGPHHVRAMAEALGRDTPARRYSPAIELHPVMGQVEAERHEVMGGWEAA